MNRFILFDVETPNHNNNRMSAIGITVVEDNEIVDEKYYLVNPECEFDPFNIHLTGITPEIVKNQMTFPEVWQEIELLFSSGLLMAHNAQFDMSVLAKCLKAYGIKWFDFCEYACTCTIGKNAMPHLPNHKLDTMCYCLNLPLDHHNAASDSRACANILLKYLEDGVDISEFVRKYDFDKICTLRQTKCK